MNILSMQEKQKKKATTRQSNKILYPILALTQRYREAPYRNLGQDPRRHRHGSQPQDSGHIPDEP